MDADSKIKCPVLINYGPVCINYGPVRINYGPVRINYGPARKNHEMGHFAYKTPITKPFLTFDQKKKNLC